MEVLKKCGGSVKWKTVNTNGRRRLLDVAVVLIVLLMLPLQVNTEFGGSVRKKSVAMFGNVGWEIELLTAQDVRVVKHQKENKQF